MMPMHDIITWSAMILGHVKCGQGHKALELSQHMQFEGVQLDLNIFVALLNACVNLVALEDDRQVEIHISQNNSHFNIFVDSSLIDMYTT
jgi:pentatricopeptide repeat protein